MNATVELLSGWRRPAAQEFEPQDVERMLQRRQEFLAKGINGNGFGLTLGMLAHLSGWPTTQARDGDGRGAQAKRADGTRMNLDDYAQLAGWNQVYPEIDPATGLPFRPLPEAIAGWTTPQASEPESVERPSREATGRTTEYLGKQVQACGWASPAARDSKSGRPGRREARTEAEDGARVNRLDQLDRQAEKLLGPTAASSPAATASSGASVLNPAMSRWLMGFPQSASIPGWDTCSPGWKEWDTVQRLLAEYSVEQEQTASGDCAGTETR